MTSLLIIIVLVLLAIALWQLTKIFDLTQVGSDLDDSQVASDDDNNLGLFNVWLLAFIYILQFMVCIHRSACSSYSCVRGAEVDNLMNITWI
jgi:cytochrome c oxidase subunit 2